MIERHQLVEFLNDLLPLPAGIEDASNNGLQVEGGNTVRKVVFGVDACLALFRRAAETKADFVFVHHGLSWGEGWRRLTGTTAERLRILFVNRLSLYASHLPLDASPQVGNNFEIARRLGLEELRAVFEYHGGEIGCLGQLPEPLPAPQLCRLINRELSTESHCFDFGRRHIKTLGIVSGGGADAVAECACRGIDALLTGEVGHQHYHVMAEAGQTVIAAGHYRTETPGVEAVARRVAERFAIQTEFIDLPTGL